MKIPPQYENHADEYREEENHLRYEREQSYARSRFISRDPFYPPEWAAQEWDEKEETV